MRTASLCAILLLVPWCAAGDETPAERTAPPCRLVVELLEVKRPLHSAIVAQLRLSPAEAIQRLNAALDAGEATVRTSRAVLTSGAVQWRSSDQHHRIVRYTPTQHQPLPQTAPVGPRWHFTAQPLPQTETRAAAAWTITLKACEPAGEARTRETANGPLHLHAETSSTTTVEVIADKPAPVLQVVEASRTQILILLASAQTLQYPVQRAERGGALYLLEVPESALAAVRTGEHYPQMEREAARELLAAGDCRGVLALPASEAQTRSAVETTFPYLESYIWPEPTAGAEGGSPAPRPAPVGQTLTLPEVLQTTRSATDQGATLTVTTEHRWAGAPVRTVETAVGRIELPAIRAEALSTSLPLPATGAVVLAEATPPRSPARTLTSDRTPAETAQTRLLWILITEAVPQRPAREPR